MISIETLKSFTDELQNDVDLSQACQTLLISALSDVCIFDQDIFLEDLKMRYHQLLTALIEDDDRSVSNLLSLCDDSLLDRLACQQLPPFLAVMIEEKLQQAAQFIDAPSMLNKLNCISRYLSYFDFIISAAQTFYLSGILYNAMNDKTKDFDSVKQLLPTWLYSVFNSLFSISSVILINLKLFSEHLLSINPIYLYLKAAYQSCHCTIELFQAYHEWSRITADVAYIQEKIAALEDMENIEVLPCLEAAKAKLIAQRNSIYHEKITTVLCALMSVLAAGLMLAGGPWTIVAGIISALVVVLKYVAQNNYLPKKEVASHRPLALLNKKLYLYLFQQLDLLNQQLQNARLDDRYRCRKLQTKVNFYKEVLESLNDEAVPLSSRLEKAIQKTMITAGLYNSGCTLTASEEKALKKILKPFLNANWQEDQSSEAAIKHAIRMVLYPVPKKLPREEVLRCHIFQDKFEDESRLQIASHAAHNN